MTLAGGILHRASCLQREISPVGLHRVAPLGYRAALSAELDLGTGSRVDRASGGPGADLHLSVTRCQSSCSRPAGQEQGGKVGRGGGRGFLENL